MPSSDFPDSGHATFEPSGLHDAAVTTAIHDHENIELRTRISKPMTVATGRSVQIQLPATPLRPRLWSQQAVRNLQFQRRWERIREDLPPQLSRKHSEAPLAVIRDYQSDLRIL